ncbi:hypothetical protein CTheo_8603 [Ceratobasidium theobromae]|uniref:Uncharacterized protein n=1 Tax=Ceratobasidium theobromae TaxID=1582974 RepID=A0A5N5Q981_9AGAM|nr:hypothetical protein CTheo_8603 [Ceratobasidium theobromae]
MHQEGADLERSGEYILHKSGLYKIYLGQDYNGAYFAENEVVITENRSGNQLHLATTTRSLVSMEEPEVAFHESITCSLVRVNYSRSPSTIRFQHSYLIPIPQECTKDDKELLIHLGEVLFDLVEYRIIAVWEDLFEENIWVPWKDILEEY